MKTNRIYLQHATAQNLPFLAGLYMNPKVREFLGGTLPEEEAFIRARNIISSDNEEYWVIYNSINQPMGLVSIGPHHDSVNKEISYQFHPDFWGQGYAFEALSLIIQFAFLQKNLPILLAETQTRNSHSIRLLNRLGFIETTRLMRFGHQQSIFQLSSKASRKDEQPKL